MNSIVVERHGSIAEVRLNRPEVRNALNGDALDQLTEIFEQFEHNDSVRVVVLTHAGEAFCGGVDLAWLESFGTDAGGQTARLQRAMLAIDRSSKLVIAAVNGPAFAGGLGLVSACDVAIATRRSTFCLTEVRIGMAPAIASSLLMRRISSGQLRYLGTTGAVIDAARAYQIGLVDQLAEDEREQKTLVDSACKLAMNSDPQAVAKFTRLLAQLLDNVADRDRIALEAFIRGRQSPNVELGLKAIRAREKAPWARSDR